MKVSMKLPANYYNALRVAVAKDDVRYYLNGIYVDFENNRWCATNGHRLLTVSFDAGDNIIPWTKKDKLHIKNIILPITHRKVATECVIDMVLNGESWTITARNIKNDKEVWAEMLTPIDGKFPDVSRVTPPWPEKDPETVPFAAYNPSYVSDVAHELCSANKTFVVARVLSTEKGGSALVDFRGIERSLVTYVLMPMRW